MPVQSEPRRQKRPQLVTKTTAPPSAEHISARSSKSIIEDVRALAFTVPTDMPESDGTFAWDRTTIVVVELRSDSARGLGYSYGAPAAAKLIGDMEHVIRGQNPMDIPACWSAMVSATRNLGRPGVGASGISAVDIALWDLKAQILGIPLVSLLGQVRSKAPIYGSGGFTSYSLAQLQTQLSQWASSGMTMVKMKIGRHPEADLERVRAAREAIGPEVQLFVDANGAYSRKQALYFADRFQEYDVRWFEEPVSSDDLEGLRLICDRAPAGMEIAAGEYGYDAWYFRRMLEAQAVDVLQADATRCLGITGFLQAGALCWAHTVPLSAHTAPSVHAHVACAVPALRHVEYFHDHARIEQMLFEGALQPVNGSLQPNLDRVGLGLALRETEAARYAVP